MRYSDYSHVAANGFQTTRTLKLVVQRVCDRRIKVLLDDASCDVVSLLVSQTY